MSNLEAIDRQLDHHERHARRLQAKTVPLIFISILLGPMGNVLLGKGMKTVGHLELHGAGDLIRHRSLLLRNTGSLTRAQRAAVIGCALAV